jgi:hypothetical protein
MFNVNIVLFSALGITGAGVTFMALNALFVPDRYTGQIQWFSALCLSCIGGALLWCAFTSVPRELVQYLPF